MLKFKTGAVRSSKKNKGRFDLLPVNAMFALARLFEKGAAEYGEGNWRKGIPKSSLMDSGLRHAFQALRGDTDEEHLIHCAWNMLCAYELKHIENNETQQEKDTND